MNPDPRIPGRLTRRRFALALPLLGALAYLAPGRALASAPGGLVRESRVLMGTRVDIVASAQGADAHEAVRQAFAEMERLEALMSRYRADSDVGRIAAAAGRHAVPVAPEVMAVLRTARRLHRESGGAFDITVGALAGWRFEPGHESVPTPAQIGRTLRLVGMDGLVLDERAGTARLARPGMALDLGGVAKLPILDAGLRALARAGVHDALVNGGGDVRAAGSLQGRPWRVGVRDPAAPARLLGVLELQGGGVVASSGDYERGFVRAGRRLHHVLDPRTGWPTEGVHGVALRARTVDEVNGWGTALMVRGAAQAGAWHAQHPGVDALVADAGGARWLSQGMAAALKNIG
jgi:thiamine biosynthesis lipoprotein